MDLGKLYLVCMHTPEEKTELMAKLDALTSFYDNSRKESNSQQDDKRGGHSINLKSPLYKFSPVGQQQSSLEIQVLLFRGFQRHILSSNRFSEEWLSERSPKSWS